MIDNMSKQATSEEKRAPHAPSRRGVRSLRAVVVLMLVAALVALSGCSTTTEPGSQASSSPPAIAEAVAAGEGGVKRSSPELATNGPIVDPSTIDLRLLKHALVMVQTKYYDPSRIDWRKMTANSFDALQSSLAEVVAEFDQPLEAGPTKVNLRVNTSSKSFDLTKIDSMAKAHETATEAVKFVVSALREQQEVNELEYTVINGMLDTLDPHSVLLTPKMFEDMQTSHGGFGGLGIVIGIRDEDLTVISPIEGTPASRAGLKAGDMITRIGEESTINMPLHEAVDRLRGEVGTAISIEVMRKGWTEPRTFDITRAKIEVRSLITHPIKEDKIAYIKIKSFEENTGEDVRKKLAAMREEMGEIKGLILDLRFNAGGLLSQAISVGDTFLSGGKTIVISEGVGGKARDEEEATDVFTEPDYPIVVIVNPGSASASEIVAGALKNHDRAVLIGEQTFGKGSVQILKENDDGSALKLTIAQYLTPGDISIQGVGVAPDVRVAPVTIGTEEEANAVDLFVSENIRREGNLELALSSEKVRQADDPVAVVRYLYDAKAEENRSGETFEEDFEILLARKMLTSTRSSKRTEFLEQVQPQLVKMADAETSKIAAELEKRGVDWTLSKQAVASQPFDVALEVSGQAVGSAPVTVRAGETVQLKASVTNTGTSAIERLFAITHSNNPILDDRELIFGRIEPGATQTWTLEIKIPRGVETRQDAISLSFGDRNGALDKEAALDLTVEGLPHPKYAYTYQIDDRAGGNGDGLLQVGEKVELVVDIANVGPGDSAETLAFIKNESGSSMFLDKGRETVGAVAAGQWATARMKFNVQGKRDKTNDLAFELTVYDKEFGASISEKVTLPVISAASWQEARGTVRFKSDTPIHGGASTDTAAIGRGKAGTRAQLTATTADGALHRIEWAQGETTRFGWVPASAVEVDTTTAATEPGAIEPITFRVAPSIEIDKPVLVASTDTISLSGTITDDSAVEDYRVYLWHRDGTVTHAQKLDYGVGGRADKKFAVDVPLRSGVNRVTIVARDTDKLEHSRNVYIYRP